MTLSPYALDAALLLRNAVVRIEGETRRGWCAPLDDVMDTANALLYELRKENPDLGEDE